MTINSKIQRRAGNYPKYLRRFLLLSLLIHGIVFLALAIYKPRIFIRPLVQKPDKLLPVQLIEVPLDEVGKTPPPNTKNLATNNSRAGGKPGSKLPVPTESNSIAAANRNATVALSHLPNSHQSKASISALSQPLRSKQQIHPLSSISKTPAISSSAIETQPKLNSHQQSSPVRAEHRLLDSLIKLRNRERQQQVQPPKSSYLASSADSSSNLPVKASNAQAQPHNNSLLETLTYLAKQRLDEHSTQSPAHQPTTSREPSITSVIPTKAKPRQTRSQNSDARSSVVRASQAPIAAHSVVHLPHPTRVAFGNGASSRVAAPTPKPKSPTSQSLQRSGASLLGGPVTLASGEFSSEHRNNSPDAARLATDFRGVDARRNDVLAPYLETLKERIRQKWHPAKPDASKRTRIVFSIGSTGQMYGLSIIQPSGSELIDQAAVKAVQRAAPFAPLPQGFSRLDIDCTFNVDVYGNLEVN